MSRNGVSFYLAYLLRHHPEDLELEMDEQGYVEVVTLLSKINEQGRWHLSRSLLDEVVATDSKGRYRYSEDGCKIKACQGHSVSWVKPEITIKPPPNFLYHGTTTEAVELIYQSGHIAKMNRHAVHMQADPEKAWKSARRWRKGKIPVVLKIAAKEHAALGARYGVTENDVWCCEEIPIKFICEILKQF